MTGSDKHLGERIKELRTQLGITQKELAGDKITRNMLSLIESGNASPSVSTLLYISERLGTSAGYFFTSSERDEGRYFKISIIDELKSYFRENNFREALIICETIPKSAVDDEIAYIAAIASLRLSLAAAKELDMSQAASYLVKSKTFSQKSIYAGERVSEALEYYEALFGAVCSDSIPALLCDYKYCGEFVPYETIWYFASLHSIKSGGDVDIGGTESMYQTKHIRAVLLMKAERRSDARRILQELALDAELPYYMGYRVLSSLEELADDIGDYRLAYSSARRKNELINKSRI